MRNRRKASIVVLWILCLTIGALNRSVLVDASSPIASTDMGGLAVAQVPQRADAAARALRVTDPLSDTMNTDPTGQTAENADISLQSYPKFLTLPFPQHPDMKIIQGWCYDFGGNPCGHRGIDYVRSKVLYPKDYWQNFPVLAAADGTAFWSPSAYGNYVMIYHTVNGQQFTTYYGHLRDVSANIPRKENGSVTVRRGDQIGTAGETGTIGCSSPCIHLHFEVHRGHGYSADNRIDPYDISKTRGNYPDPNKTNGLISGPNSLWTTNPPSHFSAVPRDTTPPDGGILTPANNTIFTTRNPIIMSAWASDSGSGVERVELKVWRNGVWYNHGYDTTAPYAVAWTPNADVRNGERFIFSIHVIDRAGNRRVDAGGSRYLTYQAPSQVFNATRFTAQHSGRVLDVSEVSTRPWQPLHQWDWVNGDNQKFTLRRVDGDWHEIRAVHSGLCLDISWASRNAGARLIQYPCNGGHNQQFRFYSSGAIQVRHSGMVLDVYNRGLHNGAAIIQWPWNGGNNQRWARSTVTYQRRLGLADTAETSPLQTDPADWQVDGYLNQRALSDTAVPADHKAAVVAVAMTLDQYGLYNADAMESLVAQIMPNGQPTRRTMEAALHAAGLSTRVVQPQDATTTWATVTNTLSLGIPVIFYSPPGEMTANGHVIVVKDYVEQDGKQYLVAHDPFGQWQGTCCNDNYAANPTRSTGNQGAWVRYDLALLPNHAQRWLLIAQPQSSATAIESDLAITSGVGEPLPDDESLYMPKDLPLAREQSGVAPLEPINPPPMADGEDAPETPQPTPTPEPEQIVTFDGATIQAQEFLWLPMIVRQ